ncbi:hypothetical protein [Serratia ficaria]|uniref:hypothetical protein n=1 Tax=Serratia ficaria TaxID=61651 RepID=UPI0012B8150F|nr:hypothetical protein [Serratia ficaria]
MIDFNAEIISGVSIGNVIINDNISIYMGEMYSRFNVEDKIFTLPDGNENISYKLDNTLTIVTDKNGVIFSLGCNVYYQGGYNGIVFPGMQVGDIIKLTKTQKIYNGSVIVNDDFGISLILPSPYDEIADTISHIPDDVKISDIFVSDYSFWR